jgi:23S rRNA (uracil1939-C5)-methyltransferase
MQDQRRITFKIDHMDSLGQGVSKESDKITFISKTLPGETGEATIVSEKKGVRFATLDNISSKAPTRIEPQCSHFNQCPSCHFLHTSYEQELHYKSINLERLFKKMTHPPLKITPAIRRVQYRNRLQLHYDLKTRQLGMLDVKNQQIAPIPQCMIGTSAVTEELKKLYMNDSWTQLIDKSQPLKGHLEIYEGDHQVKVAINRPYADGGFTQVFEEMNQLMKNIIQNWSQKINTTNLLDLFAGNGNLSEKINYSKRLCVDLYSRQTPESFLSQDLYAEDALKKVTTHLRQKDFKTSTILLDPPRSGFKNLNEWLGAFSPQHVAYVSCDPHTLVRDISSLKNYRISELHLLDFFPSTFHFETLAFLERI